MNLRGGVYFAHAAFGHMIERRSGVILRLGSVNGVAGSRAVEYSAAQPEEVVKLILYLSSDDTAFITGANYVADEGRSVGTP